MKVSFCGLQENLHAGRVAVRQVKKEYPFGFISNSRYDKFSPHRNPQISAKLAEKIFWTRDIVDNNKRHGADIYEAVEMAVKETQTANCGEQAVILSHTLNSMGIPNKVISMNIYKKDSPYIEDGHTFCVIGAKEDANWKDPSTWGKDAVIVDTWASIVDKAPTALKKFAQMMKINKKEHNVTITETSML